ncbi:MAG: acetylglutamate kinase [Polyangiaceae bacterium]
MKATPIVIKLGGEVITSPEVLVVAADVAKLGSAVIVHGGGAYATALQRKLGQEPTIVGGRRVTDSHTLDVMKMVVAGKMNVDLCSALIAAGANPVGLHGASSQVIRAHKRPPRMVPGEHAAVDFGYVGDVSGVNESLLSLLLGSGFLPVLACIGADSSGQVYNINADTVANGVAVALGARALVLISDVPAVLRDVNDPRSRIARMTQQEAKHAMETGIVTKGMVPKLEEAFAAIDAGVGRVLIVGKLAPDDLRRAVDEPGSVGTELVKN